MGDRIGKYVLEAPLGDGAMGAVYRGRDTHLGSPVAIKVIHEHLARDPLTLDRFKSEAVIQARLQHPNIVRVQDFVVADGRAAIVMEYVEGRSLHELLTEQTGPMPYERCLEVMCQVLGAVGYAHQQGIVHRDLKPSNIMVQWYGGKPHLKVTDFGIAKILGEEKSRTATHAKMGTPAYMAPEQIQSPRKVDHRADIYSLGCTLYELATGSLAYDAETEYELMNAIVSGTAPPPRSRYPHIGEEFEAVILKAMSVDPAARYQSCEEFFGALELAGGAGVSTFSHPVERPPDQKPPWYRSRVSRASLAGAVVVVAGVAFVVISSVRKERPGPATNQETRGGSTVPENPPPSVPVAATPLGRPAPRYSPGDCGSIRDRRTGLEWRVGPDRNMDWYEASAWVSGLGDCGGGWRMPQPAELAALFDRTRSAGTGHFERGRHWTAHLDPMFSEIGGGSWVWCATPPESGRGHSFNFNQGQVVTYSAADRQYSTRAFAVRAVGAANSRAEVNVEAACDRADLLLANGSPREAIRLLQELMVRSPGSSEISYRLARIYCRLNEQGLICEYDAYTTTILDLLYKAVELDGTTRQKILSDPALAHIHGTFRYQALAGLSVDRQSDLSKILQLVEWLGPRRGLYGSLEGLGFESGGIVRFWKVEPGAPRSQKVQQTGWFRVEGSAIELQFDTPVNGRSTYTGTLSREGILDIPGLPGPFSDDQSECEA